MECTLGVGESAILRRSFFGASWGRNHQSSSYNLFFTNETREILLECGRIQILELSPERICLGHQEG